MCKSVIVQGEEGRNWVSGVDENRRTPK
jgi:hypothetical protein